MENDLKMSKIWTENANCEWPYCPWENLITADSKKLVMHFFFGLVARNSHVMESGDRIPPPNNNVFSAQAASSVTVQVFQLFFPFATHNTIPGGFPPTAYC